MAWWRLPRGLRSDVALQQSFGRIVCADQSAVQAALNACTADNRSFAVPYLFVQTIHAWLNGQTLPRPLQVVAESGPP
jgi:hypothetical protein